MIYKFKNADFIEKNHVKMHIYNNKEEFLQAAVVYQETEKGHLEEFYHEKSAFIYYILEGEGKWIIEDKEYEVKARDVVTIPPGKRFYFKGNLKQLCITAPAWDEKYEKHVKYIKE
ncbi:MAG: cupin domain-containing protein [Methanobacterium sp.]|nr:cupin domain-containing protein [Methanobacterium sp.]